MVNTPLCTRGVFYHRHLGGAEANCVEMHKLLRTNAFMTALSSVRFVGVDSEEDLRSSLPDRRMFQVVDGDRSVRTETRVPANVTRGDHLVVGIDDGQDDMSGVLAERYAAALQRPFYLRRGKGALRRTAPESITIVAPFKRPRFFDWVCDQRKWMESQFGLVPPSAFLCAEAPGPLTRLMAGQILQLADTTIPQRVAVLSAFDRDKIRYIRGHGKQERSRKLSNDILNHRGPLVLQGHARPHCGLVVIDKSPVVLCSSPTEGRGGQCLGGVPCIFAAETKVSVSRLKTTRFWYDGCCTAAFAGSQLGVPVEATHGSAVLRGRVREFIGNLMPVRTETSDLELFAKLALMGHGPAAAVEAINRERMRSGRESTVSLVYLGDAANRAWISAVTRSAHDRKIRPERLGIDLRLSTVGYRQNVAARLEQEMWPNHRALSVSKGRVPTAFSSPEETSPATQTLHRFLKASAEAGFLAGLPTFGDALADAVRELDHIHGLIQRARDCPPSTRNESWLSELNTLEEQSLTLYDKKILRVAVSAATGRWDWESEYRPATRLRGSHPVHCPLCGGLATQRDKESFGVLPVVRHELICSHCMVVSDVPEWPLHVQAVDQPERNGRRVMIAVRVANASRRDRQVQLRFHLDGMKTQLYNPAATFVGRVRPRSSRVIRLTFRADQTPDNYRWCKVYMVSEAAFGSYSFTRVL